MIFLCVRSPEAPKTTSAQGSGVRRSARPSSSGFSCFGAVAVIASRSLLGALLEVAAEGVPHRRQDAVAEICLAAGGEAVEQRRGEHRRGQALLDRGLAL